MKQNLHPNYQDMIIDCVCGNKFTVGGTQKSLHVEVCDKCHPFYTGTQKFVDIKGRVDKFIAKRQAATKTNRKAKGKNQDQDNSPKTLKEMLDLNKKKLEAATPTAVAAE